jgi:Prealbumin-like fold domain
MKSLFTSVPFASSRKRVQTLRIILLIVIAFGLAMVSSSASARFAARKFVNKAVALVRGPVKPKAALRKRNPSSTLPLSPLNKRLLSPVHALLLPQFNEASVSTDKLHYEPGETVLIKGAGFRLNERVTLQVRHHDRRVEVGPAYDPWDVTADGEGGISSSWIVDPNETHGSWLQVRAKGAESGRFAMVFFTDPAMADLDQCANGPTSTPVPCTLDAWQNGNVNQNQAHYSEGNSVPYRMKFDELVVGGTNTVTISYDTTKNGKHALDYLTDYDRTASAGNNPCSGIAGCLLASETTFPIPLDPRVANGQDQLPGGGDDITQIPGSFSMFGGTITAVSGYTVSGSYAGDSTTSVTITFTSNVPNPVMAWSGHIGTRLDWGIANSAINISGSPYHMRLEDINGGGGNQDRSLSASAVFFPIAVTIVKETNPDDAQSKTFDYTTTGTGLSAFSLTPANGTTSASTNFSLNDETTRTVTESDPHASPPEFNLTNLACVQADGGLGVGSFSVNLGGRSVSFTPKEGQSITCTFTNTEDLNATRGKIIVDKVTNPSGDTTSFDFTTTYSGPFSLTDAATPNDSGLIVPGGYSVTEAANAAYVTTATCTSSLGHAADDPSSINLGAGETVTCTFTNARKPKLTVTKIVVNDNGGSKQVSDFPLFVDGNPVTSGVKNTSTVGSHSVSETTDPGYTATIGGDCAADGIITLVAGDDKTCTITNDDKAAKLIVIKHVINDNGGTATAANFSLDSGGANDSPDDFPGAEAPGTEVTLDAGAYNVTETGPSGYTASFSADCSGSLANGETKTCTVTNNDQAGKLIVIKHVINDNGGTATAANFMLDSGGPNDTPDNFPGAEAPGTEVTLDAGAYNVTETGPSGYTASFSADCSGSIANGQTKTCTVTNDDQAAKLIVIKHVINDNGGTATAANFALDSGGANDTPDNFPGAEAPGTEVTLDAGAYNVTETGPSGYTASFSAYCSGSIANGQTKTCTVTNNDISPTLRVIKDIIPDTDAGLFNLRIDGVVAGTGANVSDNGTTGFVPVNAGNHMVSETAGTATTLSDYVSVIGGDCAANGTVSLALGQNKTCTITNTKKGMAQIVKTVSGLPPAAGQSFTFEIRQGASTASDGTVLESKSTDASGNLNFTIKLVPGQTYQVCEWVFPGWNTNLAGDGPLFVPNSIIPPALPNPNVNNLTVCTNFTVQPGQTRTFTVNNMPPPGGRALTIGFWKNWASCSSSNGKGQKPMLDLALGIASAMTTSPPGGLVGSAQNPGALWPNYASLWYLVLKGNAASTANNIRPAPDCAKAVNLLNKSTTDGKKKMSSDPIFNMTAQLIAAQLNRFMGAGINGTTIMNIDRAVLLNGKYKFNGLTYSPKLTTADTNLANCLATQLDNYNNGNLVSLCP